MAASTSTLQASKPRRPWRYSLRVLFVFFTLVCVGVWYWYRVPFRREIDQSKEPGGFWWRETSGKVQLGRQVERYRRVLSGKPIREGLTEIYDRKGRRIGEEHWREGSLHGRWVRWYTSGQIRSQGEYRLGKRHGTWEHFDENGRPTLRMIYDQGRPHGNWQQFADGQVVRTILFNQGESTQIDGKPFNDPLGRAWRLNQIDDPQVQDFMVSHFGGELYRARLDQLAYLFAANQGSRVTIDEECEFDPDVRVAMRLDDVSNGAALVLIYSPFDVVATYRFGTIWITTMGDAREWTDRTGVGTLLESPPAEVTALAKKRMQSILQQPMKTVEFIDTPIPEAAKNIAESHGLPLEVDSRLRDGTVTSVLSRISLQNGMGILCDQNGWRVRWKDGTTLVIEPQDRLPNQ